MEWDWVAVLQSAVGSLFGIGAVALVYDDLMRRRREKIEKSRGFAYRPHPQSTIYRHRGTQVTSTTVRVEPIEHGVRFDVVALVWVDGVLRQKNKLASQYSETDEPLTFDVVVEHPPGMYPDVRFGLMWTTAYARRFDQSFTRTRIGTKCVEEWRWDRLLRLRAWLNESPRARLWFTGRRRPLGRWVPVIDDVEPHEWMGPVKGLALAEQVLAITPSVTDGRTSYTLTSALVDQR